MSACAVCGYRCAETVKFCPECGAADPLVPEPATARAVRKTVTVLFCDMVDSTPLGERLDPESLRSVQRRWHESMRTALEPGSRLASRGLSARQIADAMGHKKTSTTEIYIQRYNGEAADQLVREAMSG